MLNFRQVERELNDYPSHIIINNGIRYVPAEGFELLLRLYEEQKVYRTKLEEMLSETETGLYGNPNRKHRSKVKVNDKLIVV